MTNLPLLLTLADDLSLLDDLSLIASPFYESPLLKLRSDLALLGPPKLKQQHQCAGHVGQESKRGPVSTLGKEGFQVCMDVKHFKPSELNVKVLENSIIVEAKHDEREDHHGYIARHFLRRYALPKGYDPNKVASTLSSDGVLTISVPKPQIEEKSNGRIIQIQQVGPAHLNVKENSKEQIEGGDKEKEATKK